METANLGWALAFLSLAASTGAGLLSSFRWGRLVLGGVSLLSAAGALLFAFTTLDPRHPRPLILAALVVGLGFLAWYVLSRFRQRRRLSISPQLDFLSYAYPKDYAPSVLGGFIEAERRYLALVVGNTTSRPFSAVVSRLRVAGDDTELACHWSGQPGRKFVPGGGYSVDLPVGHERLLLVAQAFGKARLWALLPESFEDLFYPPAIAEDRLRPVSPAGEALSLGGGSGAGDRVQIAGP